MPAPTIEVTPVRPAAVESELDLDQARAVRPPAEPAQAKAGNYQQTHLRWRGLDIAIETESSPIANWITRSGCPRARRWGRGSDLTQYDPERGRKEVAVAAEKFFARAKDATKLYEAIEATGHPRT